MKKGIFQSPIWSKFEFWNFEQFYKIIFLRSLFWEPDAPQKGASKGGWGPDAPQKGASKGGFWFEKKGMHHGEKKNFFGENPLTLSRRPVLLGGQDVNEDISATKRS